MSGDEERDGDGEGEGRRRIERMCVCVYVWTGGWSRWRKASPDNECGVFSAVVLGGDLTDQGCMDEQFPPSSGFTFSSFRRVTSRDRLWIVGYVSVNQLPGTEKKIRRGR